MARPKSPEGKRVTICAKFSEAQAGEIDTARGGMDRSEWLRLAALAAAGRQRPREDAAPALRFVAAERDQPQTAPRRHAANCKCGMCRPDGGKR